MAADTSHPTDAWASGSAYEPYVGRWSRLVAREFVQWLDVVPGSRWLDVGCGTGALTDVILEKAQPSLVKGIDPSAEYVAFASARIPDPRARFGAGDAQSLPDADMSFDAAVSGLVLNFVPDPARALSEMKRVVRPGGTVAGYVWDYGGQMQLMRFFWNAAVALHPEAGFLDEGRRFPLCRPDNLRGLFGSAGLDGVSVADITVPTVFRDFDDFWSPFTGGQGPAPGFAVSLSESDRAALRERIRAALPVSKDGSISLVARAWAVQAVRR